MYDGPPHTPGDAAAFKAPTPPNLTNAAGHTSNAIDTPQQYNSATQSDDPTPLTQNLPQAESRSSDINLGPETLAKLYTPAELIAALKLQIANQTRGADLTELKDQLVKLAESLDTSHNPDAQNEASPKDLAQEIIDEVIKLNQLMPNTVTMRSKVDWNWVNPAKYKPGTGGEFVLLNSNGQFIDESDKKSMDYFAPSDKLIREVANGYTTKESYSKNFFTVWPTKSHSDPNNRDYRAVSYIFWADKTIPDSRGWATPAKVEFYIPEELLEKFLGEVRKDPGILDKITRGIMPIVDTKLKRYQATTLELYTRANQSEPEIIKPLQPFGGGLDPSGLRY